MRGVNKFRVRHVVSNSADFSYKILCFYTDTLQFAIGWEGGNTKLVFLNKHEAS